MVRGAKAGTGAFLVIRFIFQSADAVRIDGMEMTAAINHAIWTVNNRLLFAQLILLLIVLNRAHKGQTLNAGRELKMPDKHFCLSGIWH